MRKRKSSASPRARKISARRDGERRCNEGPEERAVRMFCASVRAVHCVSRSVVDVGDEDVLLN